MNCNIHFIDFFTSLKHLTVVLSSWILSCSVVELLLFGFHMLTGASCLVLQNLDGACIQSVNLVIDEDPRTEITLSHVGEVYRAGQYRISLPYSDGNYLVIQHIKIHTCWSVSISLNFASLKSKDRKYGVIVPSSLKF